MKKLTKLLALMLFAGFIFTACEDDGSDSQLSVEDAQQILDGLETQMSTDMGEMEESQGLEALKQLMAIEVDPFSTKKGTEKTIVIEQIYAVLSQQKSMLENNGEPFDFDAHTGTYTWYPNEQRWGVDPTTPTDKIVIIFPVIENEVEKTGKLEILDVQETLITDEYDNYYQPTRIEAKLYLNDVEVVALLLEASYDAEGDPTSAEVTFTVEPFSMELSMSSSATSGSINYALNLNDEQLMAANLSVSFTDATQENMSTIGGSVTYRDVKVEADVDMAGIEAKMEELSSGTNEITQDEYMEMLNEEIDAGIYQVSTGDKIVTLELGYVEGESSQEMGIVMVFADGTTQNAATFFASLVNQIETMMNELGLDELLSGANITF